MPPDGGPPCAHASRPSRPRRCGRIAVALTAVGISTALVVGTWPALLPFVAGAVLAYAVLPIANTLDRFMPRLLAAILAELVAVSIIVGIAVLIVPPLINGLSLVATRLPAPAVIDQRLADLQAQLGTLPEPMRTVVTSVVTDVVGNLQSALQGFVSGLAAFVTSQVLGILETASFLLGLLVVPIWVLTVVADERRIKQRGAAAVAPAIRQDVYALFRIVDRSLGTFLRVQVLVAIAVGGLVFAGLKVAEGLGLIEVPYEVAAAVLLGAPQVVPQLGFLLGFLPLLLVLAVSGPQTFLVVLVVYILANRAAGTLVNTSVSRGVLDVHPALMIPGLVAIGQLGLVPLLVGAPLIVIARDTVRYLNGRLGEPAMPANLLPGERGWVARKRGAQGGEGRGAIRLSDAGRRLGRGRRGVRPVRLPRPGGPDHHDGVVVHRGPLLAARRPRAPPGRGPARHPAPDARHRVEHPTVSDDLSRQTAVPGDADGPDQPIAVPYIQITETTAPQVRAAEALDTRDAYGRVPVVVRIRQRPPLRVEILLFAGALLLVALVVPADALLRVLLAVIAVVALIASVVTRAILRIPAGSVGLVMRAGKHDAVLPEGIHRVNPVLILTHLVTTREIAFDVPVSEVRSADGVAVTVDLLLTLGISDPAKLVYTITPSDLDQLTQAATQDAARTLVRGIDALSALDLGAAEADRLRETIDAKLAAYGVDVRGAAFTRVTLPAPLTASLEARRLASVQLAEEDEIHALAQRRLSDRTSLLAQEAEARRAAVEHEAAAEAVRLQRLEERLAASPKAARYDLEMERIRVAQALATNTRAVVSFGGGDLVQDLLVGGAASTDGPAAAPAPAPSAAAPAPARTTTPRGTRARG